MGLCFSLAGLPHSQDKVSGCGVGASFLLGYLDMKKGIAALYV